VWRSLLVANTPKIDTLVKRNHSGDEIKVQIIGTITIPLEAIITSYYTTAVVNFITWNAAYSIFPDLTFIKRKTYQLTELNSYFGKQVAKYGRRGWKTLETVWDDDREYTKSLPPSENMHAVRRIGDSKTWKINLDTTGVTPGAPSYTIEYSFFKTSLKERTTGTRHKVTKKFYQVDARIFKSCVLQHKYLVTQSANPTCTFWWEQADRLNDLTRIECTKLKGEERPFLISRSHAKNYYKNTDRVHSNTPEGWTFWDAEIPKWEAAYEKRQREKGLRNW
jgi:hypothetical protein